MKTSSQRDGRHLHLTWRDVIDAVRKLTATVQPNEQNFDAASDVRGAAFASCLPTDISFPRTTAPAPSSATRATN